MSRIAVVAGGSAAPGLGTLARAAAAAAAAAGAEAVAWTGGFGGAPRPLDPAGPDPDLAPAPFPDLLRPEGAVALAGRFRGAGVTGLVVAGGEGAAAGAAALARAGLPAVLVPATVQDDVRGTDACIGVDTLVNAVLRRIAGEAAAGGALLVDVPGALTGHAALLAAVGAAASGAILVERPFPWREWASLAGRGAGPVVLLRAEGAGTAAEAAARMAAALPGREVKVLPEPPADRLAAPSLFDRLLALRMGEAAAAALLGGAGGRMIAFRAGLCMPVLLEEVAGRRRQVPAELFEIAKKAGVLFEER
ncbi:MAG: 6-phosphofructokinase [Planctomycetes bacterium]|nr:6-phosphofructokinase [Planctomycetota bacterium]